MKLVRRAETPDECFATLDSSTQQEALVPSTNRGQRVRILCAGTLIVDIINEPVERALGPNEGVNTRIMVNPGGNAFNVAVNLVRLGARGAEVTCAGAVGEDLFADIFTRCLDGYGIEHRLYSAQAEGTSKIFMLKVRGDEPRYYLDPGANACLDPDFLLFSIDEIKPSIFYIGEAGTLPLLLADFATILAEAKKHGSITVADMVVPQNEDWSFLIRAAQFIDVLKLNQFESQPVPTATWLHLPSIHTSIGVPSA